MTTRCAIYTRKSHEEGLEQAFNSLDAQREAALDYIRSQKHQGWQPIETCYDDGGYSGGTLERPALKQLLEDIERGRIDVVVVYKVDRLSRSLHDFAGIMKTFDAHGVSFVSVTQQFNTTTSMGRLTLNMLLSFAQFEREVTGERIRDKLAATKKKGLWVTGRPPLGYEAVEQKLVVVPEEARVVRRIYEEYLESGSLVQLARQLHEEGHTTKRWSSRRGQPHGGRRLTPKYLYRILTNPVYTGKITHKDNVWPGQHEPVIEQELWDRVQAAIEKRERQTTHRWTHTHLLKGRLRTTDGFAMSPGAVQRPAKADGQRRLVRYYVSQKAIKRGYKQCAIKSINAQHVDDLVRAVVLDHLEQHEKLDGLRNQEPQVRDQRLRELIHRVLLAPEQLTVELDAKQIEALRNSEGPQPDKDDAAPGDVPTCLYRPEVERRGGRAILTLGIQVKRLDGRRMLLAPEGHDLLMPAEPEPQDHIVRAIGQAYRWKQLLEETGQSLERLAERLPVSERRVRKLLPLTLLGPDILRRVLTGDTPPSLTLDDLLHAAQHLDWQRQMQDLGLDRFPSRDPRS